MLKNKITIMLIALTFFSSQNIFSKNKLDKYEKKKIITQLENYTKSALNGKLDNRAIDASKKAMYISVYKIRSEALRVLKAILKNSDKLQLDNNDFKGMFEAYMICITHNKNPITKVRSIAGLKRLHDKLGNYIQKNKTLLTSNKNEFIKSDQPILLAYRSDDYMKTEATFHILGFIFKLLSAMLTGIADSM